MNQEQEEQLKRLNRDHRNPSLRTDLGLEIQLLFVYLLDFGIRRSHLNFSSAPAYHRDIIMTVTAEIFANAIATADVSELAGA